MTLPLYLRVILFIRQSSILHSVVLHLVTCFPRPACAATPIERGRVILYHFYSSWTNACGDTFLHNRTQHGLVRHLLAIGRMCLLLSLYVLSTAATDPASSQHPSRIKRHPSTRSPATSTLTQSPTVSLTTSLTMAAPIGKWAPGSSCELSSHVSSSSR